MKLTPHDLDQLRRLIASARSITVLTGAGVSAESGIPTFRDAQTGHWARFRPEELATPEAFRRDPDLVWRWYAERRRAVLGVEPNAGHRALARLHGRVGRFSLITQNVDGLHARAGSREVIELHGSILRVRCFHSCVTYTAGAATAGTAEADAGAVAAAGELEASAVFAADSPPRCPHCGDFLRPDVVWFGENLPEAAIEAAVAASESCELFLSIGTSTVVYPAAMLPHAAADAGATVVEINPEETPFTARAHLSIRGTAATVLPAVID
ncbi:MAG: NAD-dependent deacylase [Spirochaetaceae bacterium]|nr:MAG: NAD-dependent deacylase [Spirochaetaceae bacterium]